MHSDGGVHDGRHRYDGDVRQRCRHRSTLTSTPDGVTIGDAGPVREAGRRDAGRQVAGNYTEWTPPSLNAEWTTSLALAPGVVVAYERNVQTNARPQDAGIEASLPRRLQDAVSLQMSCPAARDPL